MKEKKSEPYGTFDDKVVAHIKKQCSLEFALVKNWPSETIECRFQLPYGQWLSFTLTEELIVKSNWSPESVAAFFLGQLYSICPELAYLGHMLPMAKAEKGPIKFKEDGTYLDLNDVLKKEVGLSVGKAFADLKISTAKFAEEMYVNHQAMLEFSQKLVNYGLIPHETPAKEADYALKHPGMQKTVVCPISHDALSLANFYYTAPLKNIIMHLNDEHKWTREQIADWLDTLDEQPIFYPEIEVEDEASEIGA